MADTAREDIAAAVAQLRDPVNCLHHARTIANLLDRVSLRHHTSPTYTGRDVCGWCDCPHPCPDLADAAALAVVILGGLP